jgi:hypothetical protein
VIWVVHAVINFGMLAQDEYEEMQGWASEAVGGVFGLCAEGRASLRGWRK